MGEPIADRDPRRFQRSLTRIPNIEGMVAFFGSSDHLVEVLRRLRQVTALPEIPGNVIYDVDPIVFDDLIEIRTGGDRSVEAFVNTSSGVPSVSFWPLVLMSPNDVMAGWEDALRRASDGPHEVLAEVNSPLEQVLTFDFGYIPFARDVSRLRRMTSPRFVEELREAERRRRDPTTIRPRRPLFFNEYENVTSSRYTVTDPFIYERSPLPPPSVEDDALEPDEIDAWIADHSVFAWGSTLRVTVDVNGLDSSGEDPTTPGYMVGGCNCPDCRETRLQEAADEDDYEASYDDGDYEEDEE